MKKLTQNKHTVKINKCDDGDLDTFNYVGTACVRENDDFAKIQPVSLVCSANGGRVSG